MHSKAKAIVLRTVFVLFFAAICLWAFTEELHTSSFFNGVNAFGAFIPSVAVLVSNILWFFADRFSSKQSFAKWSALTFVLACLVGTVCGFVHYELPLYIYLLAPGLFISVFFGIVVFLFSNIYFRLVRK